MSFEVFLCCYENGEPAGISETSLRDVFSGAIAAECPEFRRWRLAFGDGANDCDLFLTYLENDPACVKALLVSRPVNDVRLWESLYRIMSIGNIVLFSPGILPTLFAHERAIAHFPPDMLEALGEPVIISSGADIARTIASS